MSKPDQKLNNFASKEIEGIWRSGIIDRRQKFTNEEIHAAFENGKLIKCYCSECGINRKIYNEINVC